MSDRISKDHPEHRCDDCGGRNIIWNTNNKDWNRIIRPHGEVGPDPMLCPRCFAVRFDEHAGKPSVWQLVRERPTYQRRSRSTSSNRGGRSR